MAAKRVRMSMLAAVLLIALSGCAAAPSAPKSSSAPAATPMITNEPLAANTAEDAVAAEAVLRAYLDRKGLHPSQVKRPGFSTSDDIPADWFQSKAAKPFKVIGFIAPVPGRGGGAEYTLVRMSESSTWTVYVFGQ